VSFQRLPRFDEEISLRKASSSASARQCSPCSSRSLPDQGNRGRLRRVPFLEDARLQDAKRIAQLQQESIEALKRTEQLNTRTQTVQDTTVRQERNLTELREVVAQLRAPSASSSTASSWRWKRSSARLPSGLSP